MKQLTLTLDDATFASAESQAKKAGKPLTSFVITWLKSFSAGAETDLDCLTREDEKTRLQAPPRFWIDAFSGDADDEFLARDFPLEDRKTMPVREFSFQPDEE